MQRTNLVRLATVVALASLLLMSSANAAIFGEVSLSAGGTFPQGTFTKYADPGFLINFRATIHIPNAEFLSFWFDLGGANFGSEELFTTGFIPGGPTFEVTQTTNEYMIASHIGLQLGNTTKRAFFRPRAGWGIGLYGFNTKVTWTTDLIDTTVTLDEKSTDSQTKFGWRGTIGADLFISSQVGIAADFVYDQVFGLNQTNSPVDISDEKLTSRFHGFSIGIVYMFLSNE